MVNLTLDGILPGDFMDQSRTLWTHRIEPLDYPVNPTTVERLKALKEESQNRLNTSKASSAQ